MAARIRFNKPFIAGKELYYVAQAVTQGNLAGDGNFTNMCCRLLEERLGIPKVLLVPSCTAALEMAAMLFDLKPGDEVIVPSFTFVSTVNAFVLLEARPVFVDVRSDTLNIDDALIEYAITEQTRAIFPVHHAGIACDMDRIMTIARKFGLRVAEDAAQGVNVLLSDRATRDGLMRYLGERGILAVFHYVPLHSSPMGQTFGYRPGDLPVTEEFSGRLLRLPLYHDITEEEQLRVVTAVRSYLQEQAVHSVAVAGS